MLSSVIKVNGCSEAGTVFTTAGLKGPMSVRERLTICWSWGSLSSAGEIQWIEPVEVWGSFRAAHGPHPRDRQSGLSTDGSCFTTGSHDGFDRFGASQVRRVQLIDARSHQIICIVDDMVTTSRSLYFRQWWHLAPGIPNALLNGLIFDGSTAEAVNINWHRTWFSEAFGQRTPRQSLCISGCLPPGEHLLRITLPLSATSL